MALNEKNSTNDTPPTSTKSSGTEEPVQSLEDMTSTMINQASENPSTAANPVSNARVRCPSRLAEINQEIIAPQPQRQIGLEHFSRVASAQDIPESTGDGSELIQFSEQSSQEPEWDHLDRVADVVEDVPVPEQTCFCIWDLLEGSVKDIVNGHKGKYNPRLGRIGCERAARRGDFGAVGDGRLGNNRW